MAVRVLAAATTVGLTVVSLSGCGGGGGSTTVGPNGTASPDGASTTGAPDSRTPLYLVMRMDDINPVDHPQNQTDIMQWFLDHNLKYNMGIILGSTPGDPFPSDWPTTCAESPTDLYCDSSIVRLMNQAYNDGKIVGTSDDAIFEIGSHSWDHESWGGHWTGYVPAADWAEWQAADMNRSVSTLRALYPDATIRYFAAPTNMASSDTLAAMKQNGLDIITTAWTVGCGDPDGPAAGNVWDLTPPCGVQDANSSSTVIRSECKPQGNVWFTTEGAVRVQDVVSAPAGTANTNWAGGGQQGITVEETIGLDYCGCKTETHGADMTVLCSLVSSAVNNAAVSNGLHWSVLMMHPPSVFPGGQSYPDWLTDFYEALRALEDYNVQFITFSELADMKAPGASETVELV